MPQRTLVNGHQSDACRCKAQGGLESCMVQTVRLTSSKHRPQQATDADTTQCQCRRDMQPCVNCSSVSDVDSTVKNARFGLVYSWRLIRLALHPPFCWVNMYVIYALSSSGFWRPVTTLIFQLIRRTIIPTLVLYAFLFFQLRARTEQTGKQTDGQDEQYGQPPIGRLITPDAAVNLPTAGKSKQTKRLQPETITPPI